MFNLGARGGGQGKTRQKVGLDIGSDSIKAAEIVFSDALPAITALSMKKLPDHTQSAISDSIKMLFEEARISASDVAISVSGPNVVVRLVTMPKMRDEDLKNAIKFEAEKLIPFNIGDCVFDFQVLAKDSKENKVNIVLAVAKKAYVMEKIKAVEGAGLTVSLVDADIFALANAFLKNFNSLDAGKSTAVLNIGANLTNLCILRGSSICFARDMGMGGADFLAAISKKLGVELKSSGDLRIVTPDRSQDIITYAKQALGNFIDEVRLSFSYYENQGGMGIDEIYVSGGAADLTGLAEAFEEGFASKPVNWDPLKFADPASIEKMAKPIEGARSAFAVALGLALR